MKKIITTLFFTVLLTTLFAQSPPPCGSNPAAGNTCSTPTPICDLNGYCGNTSASYTANTWGIAGTPIGCGTFGLFPCPGTGIYAGFCGTIENNSFLTFVASATTITLDVWVSNCTSGNGIQIMIFETANCNDDVTSYYCNGAMSPSPIAQSISASGLTIGQTYYIMIDGNYGDVCDYTFSANSGILVPVYVSPTDTTICGGDVVNLTAGGGDGNYNWNASPDLNTTVGSNVIVTAPSTPGLYSYTVNSISGNTNCPAASTATANITVASCCVIGFAAVVTNPTCLNNVGSIDLTITNGSGNYSYDWGGGIISQDLTGIGVGSYTVTVTDITQGCSRDTTIVLSTANSFAVSAIVSQPTCGNNDGSINLTPNPAGSYTYTWLPNVSSSNSASNLLPGNYQINITQGVCSWDTTITLNVPTGCGCISPLSLAVDSTDNTKCGGSGASSCDGTATVSVISGAAGPYTYQWNDPLNQTTATADSLCPGNYCVTVTDSSGNCIETICVEVIDDSKITFTTQVNQPDCSNNNGEITLTPDFVGIYTYVWTPNVSSSNTATSLNSGTYLIEVTNGICSWDTSITLTAPTTFNISATVSQPTCGNNNGSILITPSPAGVYNYSWSPNVSTTNAASALNFGSYQIVISDGSCAIDTTIILSSPNQPNITTVNTVQPSCGNNNGEINIIVTGGINPINYSINNGSSSQLSNTFTGLTDGIYSIVVTDLNGCIDTTTVALTNIAAPVITTINVNDENCTSSDGIIIITAIGSGAISYSIDGGLTNQVSNTFTGLTHGNYNIVVTDANCSTTQAAAVGQINNVNASFTVDPSTGFVPLIVNFTNTSIGASSYTWTFGDGNSDTIINPMNNYTSVGDYMVTLIVTDGLGCYDTAKTTIVVTDQLTILIPNVFTPNGDNQNDVFTIKTTFVDELNVVIFNRWGREMYQIKEPGGFWDGKDASNGTYFFVLKAKSQDGEEIKKTGSITLIR